jgi:hypothetical protein
MPIGFAPMFRLAIRDVLWLTVVVMLCAMLIFLVVGLRSEGKARLELFRHTDRCEYQLEHLLAQLENESPGTVKDEWDRITVTTKGGKTFVFTLYSRQFREPWTK